MAEKSDLPPSTPAISDPNNDEGQCLEVPSAFPVLKTGATEYLVDHSFEKACVDYISRHCLKWKEFENPFMFPPAFPVRYIAPTGDASGAMPLTKHEESDVKGDNAELVLFHGLEKFSREKSQPMFTLTKFEFGDFIKSILSKQVSSEECHLLLKSSGEVDFLVIHRYVGIILFEVKAVEKFRPARYQDAKKQLDGAELFLRALLGTKKSGKDIPIYKVVALPSVPTPGRSQSGDYIDLRECDLSGVKDLASTFENWWRSHLPRREFDCDQEQVLLHLVALLVGQRASLCSTCIILADMHSKIDSQVFLARAYEKQLKKLKYRHASAAASGVCTPCIAKTSEYPKLSVLANQFVFLNPEQLSIWDGPKRQLLTGVTGSGKTILIQHKALECVQHGEQVVIFVPTPLDQLYEHFFSENSDFQGTLKIVSFARLQDFVHARNDKQQAHIFADEFQALIANTDLDFSLIKKYLTSQQHPEFYQWICFDVIQTLNELMYTDSEQRWEEFGLFRIDLCKTLSFSDHGYLTTTMRYTKELYNVLSSLEPYNQRSSAAPLKPTFKDLESPSIFIGHNISGPEVLAQVLPGADVDEQMKFASHYINKEVEEWATSEGQRQYSKVAVLTDQPENIGALQQCLHELEFPVCDIGEQKNAISLGVAEQSRSFEWPIVVAFCEASRIHHHTLLISRAMVRLLFLHL